MTKETKKCQKMLFKKLKYIPNKNYFNLCHMYYFKCVCTHLDITYRNIINKKNF